MLVLLVMCAPIGQWGEPTASAQEDTPVVLITGVYFDGFLSGNPEPEEAIRLTNMSQTKSVDISDWRLSDKYLSLKRKAQRKTQRRRRSTRRRKRRSRRSRRSRRRRRRSRRRRRRSRRRRRRSRRRSRRRRRRRSRRSGSRRSRRSRRGSSIGLNEVILPSGLTLPPGGSIWVTYKAKAFFKVFGQKASVEAVNTDDSVPDATLKGGWPKLFATRGALSLHNSSGEAVDLICYVRNSDVDTLDHRDYPAGLWNGPSVMLRGANPYSWTGQILARDRRADGTFAPDTNSAADWNSSFGAARLGVDETHRVERPGQSNFQFPTLRNARVEMLATSAPENNYATLTNAFRKARREILVNIYKFTNYRIAIPLVQAARRGVKVTVLMEGAPVGGVEERSRYIARMLTRARVKVLWMRGIRRKKIIRRYRFNHAKYVIIDRRWVIVGSENYGTTGHPVHPSQGNRGWEIHIKNKALANQLLKVFRHDTDTSRFQDLVPYKNKKGFKWGPPKSSFRPSRSIRKGVYDYRKRPRRIRGRADIQLVLSPDNSLHEKGSLIGTILSCKREVLVTQNSIPLFWGRKNKRSFSKTPDLPLMAVIEAARKGCRVRVLIDSVWYHISTRDPRDNDNAVQKINEIARRENLDLQAKLINLESVGISKIHTKGVIVDREKTFIGSINWSENSFKGNREVGVVVRHKQVAQYYADLFLRDWLHSRLFRVSVKDFNAPVYAKPNVTSKVLRIFAIGDPVDVLAETGEYYQVRLNNFRVGYMRKAQHIKIFNPFEARFQVGRIGVLVGRVKRMYKRKKTIKFFFDRLDRSGLHLMVWQSSQNRFERKLGRTLKRALVGKYVQVYGRISSFRGRPQIVIRDPNDLTILD